MYKSENIELILKGENEGGKDLDKMSYDEVKTLLESDNKRYINKMQEMLGTDNIKPIVSYNQLYGQFTETIRNAVHDLGLKIYFEQYVSEYGYIDSLPDFDVMQYSVSFTISGHAGPNETFKQPEQIEQEILNFNNDHLLYINGKKVVSTLCHQQDFRISENSDALDQNKWNIYTTVLNWAKSDPRIHLLTAKEIYELRHPSGE
jgi:hypothetical protein